MSQSSLSKQIKAWENELNILLFNRTTRSISLVLFIYKNFHTHILYFDGFIFNSKK
ncbi:helix-turn-helix domain-containing protein [Terrisporobacter othiniensis]|uniref:helix-turn-helix domain-containing protein n=1 Tax=Terrisporobacter othiniensis TaxID=1577792 RepID=UPI0009A924FF